MLILAVFVFFVSCGKSKQSGPVTLTVWDYYGAEGTPIKALIPEFEKENPNIKINYQILDWNSTFDKLNVVLTGDDVPDMVTIDMTWLPTWASKGVFQDLNQYAKDELNGVALDKAYGEGAIKSMTYNGEILTMLYDFDAYCLYYRSDIFESKGIKNPPKTWDELESDLKLISSGNKNKFPVRNDVFHISQFIYQNGGSILNEDNSKAVFNSPEGIEGIEFYAGLVKKGYGVYWTESTGEPMVGIKDNRIVAFEDGPYYMGLLKSAAPELAGKWKIAPAPIKKQAGSYLGGTGLVIPTKSKNGEAAWKLIEFLMREKNQVNMYTSVGVSPALSAALESAEVDKADPYFGGQKVFGLFKDAMASARPFPYIKQWNEISDEFTALADRVCQKKDVNVKEIVNKSAESVDKLLKE